MHTLRSQPDQKEARRSLTTDLIAVYGLRRIVSRSATTAPAESPAVPVSVLRRFSSMAVQ